LKGQKTLIDSCASITQAKNNDLTFCYYPNDIAIEYILKSDAGVILCNSSIRNSVDAKPGQQLVFVSNPRLELVQILSEMIKDKRDDTSISPLAFFNSSASVGQDCSIGECSVIRKNCVVGKKVSPEYCIIGDNCIIQSGSTIGEDGFAYERKDSGKLIHFRHLGKVMIGNDVDIEANCSIARGSMSNTIIGSGSKLDALVHIAHNVSIGSNCELTAGTIIGGSSFVGNYSWLELNSTLKDNTTIGDHVIVGAGALVISNVPDDDIVGEAPAKSNEHEVKTNMKFLMAGERNDESNYSKLE
jgi:UDP-3-O-[3-hydroxymyristoyl] glucosamine N-acyltransferase